MRLWSESEWQEHRKKCRNADGRRCYTVPPPPTSRIADKRDMCIIWRYKRIAQVQIYLRGHGIETRAFNIPHLSTLVEIYNKKNAQNPENSGKDDLRWEDFG